MAELAIADLVFVGFNKRVAALHRVTGQLVWQWKAAHAGYVSLLLDLDRLIVSVNGYTYCLNPLTGQELWYNELSGFGIGVPSLASANGSFNGILLAAADQEAQQSHADSTTTTPPNQF